ncbi:signal peptidase I [Halorubrum sp. DTA46]|uniref:signal peptidase I n=1 Tax=Halorubrum sp. DTA46 TaxID=3402162 RepID=UPI003AABE005
MNLPISLKTLANALGIVLLIALVAPFVVYAVPGIVGAEHSFVVLTASMTPAIAPGDVVIVDERDPATIAEGDVITFVRSGNEVPVTHRVIDVVDGANGVAFETQGDANGGPDASLVSGENVLGVVAITIPYIGYVIQFAGSPLGFVALVVVPFGLLALSELWSIVRARSAAPGTADAVVAADTADDVGTAATTEAASDEPVGVSLDAVVGAAAVLLAFAPYSVYVASQSLTALSLTVAIAATMLLLGAVAVWVSATGLLRRSDSMSETNTAADEVDVADPTGTGEDAPPSSEPPMIADGAAEAER